VFKPTLTACGDCKNEKKNNVPRKVHCQNTTRDGLMKYIEPLQKDAWVRSHKKIVSPTVTHDLYNHISSYFDYKLEKNVERSTERTLHSARTHEEILHNKPHYKTPHELLNMAREASDYVGCTRQYITSFSEIKHSFGNLQNNTITLIKPHKGYFLPLKIQLKDTSGRFIYAQTPTYWQKDIWKMYTIPPYEKDNACSKEFKVIMRDEHMYAEPATHLYLQGLNSVSKISEPWTPEVAHTMLKKLQPELGYDCTFIMDKERYSFCPNIKGYDKCKIEVCVTYQSVNFEKSSPAEEFQELKNGAINRLVSSGSKIAQN
jgi:hypothetical protein